MDKRGNKSKERTNNSPHEAATQTSTKECTNQFTLEHNKTNKDANETNLYDKFILDLIQDSQGQGSFEEPKKFTNITEELDIMDSLQRNLLVENECTQGAFTALKERCRKEHIYEIDNNNVMFKNDLYIPISFHQLDITEKRHPNKTKKQIIALENQNFIRSTSESTSHKSLIHFNRN